MLTFIIIYTLYRHCCNIDVYGYIMFPNVWVRTYFLSFVLCSAIYIFPLEISFRRVCSCNTASAFFLHIIISRSMIEASVSIIVARIVYYSYTIYSSSGSPVYYYYLTSVVYSVIWKCRSDAPHTRPKINYIIQTVFVFEWDSIFHTYIYHSSPHVSQDDPERQASRSSRINTLFSPIYSR